MGEFYDAEWPNMNNVAVLLPFGFTMSVPCVATGIMYRMAVHIGYKGVNSFYRDAAPNPSLPSDEKSLVKIIGCTRKEWKISYPYIEGFFEESDGRLWLNDLDILRFTKPNKRKQISKDVKDAAMEREGMRCAYCGAIEGPFQFDHLYPVSRGGRNIAANIVVACTPCNQAKSDKTLVEWVRNAQ